jgi:chromosome segregation ATPase
MSEGKHAQLQKKILERNKETDGLKHHLACYADTLAAAYNKLVQLAKEDHQKFEEEKKVLQDKCCKLEEELAKEQKRIEIALAAPYNYRTELVLDRATFPKDSLITAAEVTTCKGREDYWGILSECKK